VIFTNQTLNSFPEVAEGLEAVDLVESSEVMKALQQKALAGQANVRWSDTIESVPHCTSSCCAVIISHLQLTITFICVLAADAFTFFVAHEFFDALPIHIFQRAPSPTPSSPPTFLELLVSHTPPSEHLHLTLSPSPTPMSTYLPTTSAHFAAVLEGERIEVSPAAHTIMSKLGKLLEPRDGRGGGAGLVVDYGKDGLTSESFRVSFYTPRLLVDYQSF
jgi:NADH dehydrogenase [ubiquinone] 1 alpha subcomplex assembly factor 7